MRKSKLLGIFIFSFFALMGIFLLHPSKALAATFTVDSVNDGADVDTGDNLCDDSGGDCTLRAAIDQANATSGADTINFTIPGAGVHTITPGSNFAQITEAVTIDGSTQPGSSCGTLVPTTLPVSSNTPHTLNIFIMATGMQTTFDIAASNTTIKGFAIADAQSQQINISGEDAVIECNYLGTNSSGDDIAGANNQSGIYISSNNNTIQNNLVSSNGYGGIASTSNESTSTIQNNLIGTNENGAEGVNSGNGGVGISVNGGDLVIHNVISGNTGNGITTYDSSSVIIRGNYIGVTLDGDAFGNQQTGINVFSTSDFTIGGTNAADRNVISANNGDGIHIHTNCSGSSPVARSTIYGNYIGTKVDGTVSTGYGNTSAGIQVNEYQSSCGSVYQHKIGGDNAGEPNIIAGNTTEGVLIHQDSGHDVFSIAVIKNSIFDNGTLGIDLAADSDSSSGIADTDMGPNPLNDLLITYPTPVSNSYLNHPVINSAKYNGNNIEVNYDFVANAVQDSDDGYSLLVEDLVGYRLDFYINDTLTDGAYEGFAQGKTHLGSFVVDGSATGATHTFASPITPNSNQTITVTATLLWTNTPGPAREAQLCTGGTDARIGNGPRYRYVDPCESD